MSVVDVIQRAREKFVEHKWPKLYWAIDLHNTIIPSSRVKGTEVKEFYPFCKEALQEISKREDCCIILFTSTYNYQLSSQLIMWFRENDIKIGYVNQNPECESTQYADFSQKFYYDVLIDDKAGFSVKLWKDIFRVVKGWNNENAKVP
jgi:hypothetical protein